MGSKISPEATTFIVARLKEIKKKYLLTDDDIAVIVGMNRGNVNRVLRNRVQPRLDMLYALAQHFEFPMSFWFPSTSAPVLIPAQSAEPLKSPPKMSEVQAATLIHGHTPLTKKMLAALAQLSPSKKRHLIVLAIKHHALIGDAMKLAILLEQLEIKRRHRLMKAIKIIVDEFKHKPVP